MENIVFFIQARADSFRLPQKMLRTFCKGKTILQIIIERLVIHFPLNKIYVLTTDTVKDDELVKSISHYPVNIFRGEENKVLERFIAAGEYFEVEHIVRVCADNPFLDINYINQLLEMDMQEEDYMSYSVLGVPVIKCHYGLFTERTRLSSLKRIPAYTDSFYYYEHVTNFMYENDNLFKCKLVDISAEMIVLEKVRLTVDTANDFENTRFIYNKLEYPLSFTSSDIVKILERYPEIRQLMYNEIQLNTK